MKRFIDLNLAVVAGSLIICGGAFAETITVTDCNGVPRALEQMDAGQSATVKLTSKTPINSNGLVYITDTKSGQKMSGKMEANSVMFDKMEPGTYTICGNSAEVMKSQVTISTSTATASNSSKAAPLLLGAAAVAGGAVAIANSNGSDGSSTSDPVPNTAGASVVDDTPTAISTGTNNPSNPCVECQKRTAVAAQDCLNSREPTPVSPFL